MKDYVAPWTSFLSKNDIAKNKMGNIHCKKLMKLENSLKYFIVSWPGSGPRNKVSFNHIYW